MLRELRIRNMAVVEDVGLEFADGLNALTGSTGAGKSIILTAVELLSGGRPRRSLIRKGASALSIEGIFAVPPRSPLRARLCMAEGDSDLSIRREIGSDGRGRVWVNGMASTVAAIEEASSFLFELHGQRRQQEFLAEESHIEYLDAQGDYGDLLARTRAAADRWNAAVERLERLIEAESRHREQEDYLRFQLRELEDLRLEPGIDRRLETAVRRLENVQRYMAALEEARAALAGEESAAVEGLSRATRALDGIASIDEAWGAAAAELKGARAAAQETLRLIDRALAALEAPGEDLETLEERLAALQRASRKHRLDADGLIAKRDELRSVLSSLDGGGGEIAEARREIAALRTEIGPLLAQLGERRSASAARLDRHVTAELQKLGMKGALFATRVSRPENCPFLEGRDEVHLSPRGLDRVEFMIRTNVGEEMHPLAEIASGGELSRVTLILKEFQVEERGIPTLIFDEIDAGLGADLGSVVADRLRRLSGTYQTIVITHLPQVAAAAGHHLKIAKRVRSGRTVTTASILDGNERIEEIARMLGGAGGLREELAAELLSAAKGRP